MASLTAGGRALATARGHDERTWTQRAGRAFWPDTPPDTLDLIYLRFNKQGWGRGKEAARPGRVRVFVESAPGGARPCGRDGGGQDAPPDTAVKGGGAGGLWVPSGPAAGEGIRGERERVLPQQPRGRRGGHRELLGCEGRSVHTRRDVPSDRIAVFPLVWAVAFISGKALQDSRPRKREGQTNTHEPDAFRRRDAGSRGQVSVPGRSWGPG